MNIWGRNWKRLPYPKFLETTQAEVLLDGGAIWQGKCIFSFRGRLVRQNDGRHKDFTAAATMSADLTGIMGKAHRKDMEFCALVKIGGVMVKKSFDVVEVLPSYEPCGSFHHIVLRLAERAVSDDETDEICEESGCGEADYAEDAGCLGADRRGD